MIQLKLINQSLKSHSAPLLNLAAASKNGTNHAFAIFESRFNSNLRMRSGLVQQPMRMLMGCGKPPGPNEIEGVRSFYFKVGQQIIPVKGRLNENVLEVAHNYELDEQLQGVCGQSMMCATCHVYIPDELIQALPYPPDPMEVETLEDNLKDPYFDPVRSRLGCQIKVNQIIENCTIEIPHGSLMADLAP